MPTYSTGLVFDERYLSHDTGVETTVTMRDGSFTLPPEPHPSALYITQRIKQFLDGSGLTARMQLVAARAANEDELAVYHTREYIAGIRALCDGVEGVEGVGVTRSVFVTGAYGLLGSWMAGALLERGNRVTVLLNGALVINRAELPSVPPRGPLGLQNHGDPVEFRNLFLKELE